MNKYENKDHFNLSAQDNVEGPIPYGRQYITEEDIQAVVAVLRSDYLTQGPKIVEFEEAFANYVGSKYAVAVSNGTAALHLCNLALGVKTGDKVITTPITFVATANSVLYCGGEVVFADIEPETYLLDIKKVQELIETSPRGTFNGIILVDFAGRAINLEGFRKLADDYDLWIIEDSCHAPGGFFIDSKGKKQTCGNGNYADLAIFSFHPVKHIATGEGGMITTNDKELYQKLLKLRTHGITKNDSEFKNFIEFALGSNQNSKLKTQDYPKWYMEMQDLGYNYRLTDFQAALGISQLKRAAQGIKRRSGIASRYYRAFKDIYQITDRNIEANGEDLTANSEHQTENSSSFTISNSTDNSHAYHLYIIEVEDRLGLYNYLRQQNIFSQIHYIPCHLMPYYRQFGWNEGDLTVAEEYYSRCLSLPMYPSLTDDEQNFVIQTIYSFYGI